MGKNIGAGVAGVIVAAWLGMTIGTASENKAE